MRRDVVIFMIFRLGFEQEELLTMLLDRKVKSGQLRSFSELMRYFNKVKIQQLGESGMGLSISPFSIT